MPDLPVPNWGIDFSTLSAYDRNLPHWRQEDAVYFVTFRLADSIPRSVIEAWHVDRQTWLKAHGIDNHLTVEEQGKRLKFVPTEIRRAFERDQARQLFVELDACHGSCYLQDMDKAGVVSAALRYFDGVRLHCGDFVVMPNHVHWLLIPQSGYKLEAILHSVKRHTARKINERLGRTGPFWQKESFDHIVRNAEELEHTRNYIRENLAKANLRREESRYFKSDWV